MPFFRFCHEVAQMIKLWLSHCVTVFILSIRTHLNSLLYMYKYLNNIFLENSSSASKDQTKEPKVADFASRNHTYIILTPLSPLLYRPCCCCADVSRYQAPEAHGGSSDCYVYMYLYSLAFMDHPCTLGAAVCHQAPPCPLYTQPRARRV